MHGAVPRLRRSVRAHRVREERPLRPQPPREHRGTSARALNISLWRPRVNISRDLLRRRDSCSITCSWTTPTRGSRAVLRTRRPRCTRDTRRKKRKRARPNGPEVSPASRPPRHGEPRGARTSRRALPSGWRLEDPPPGEHYGALYLAAEAPREAAIRVRLPLAPPARLQRAPADARVLVSCAVAEQAIGAHLASRHVRRDLEEAPAHALRREHAKVLPRLAPPRRVLGVMRVKLRGSGRLALVEPSLLLPVGRLAAVLGQVLGREASARSTSREDAATRALRTRLRMDAVRDRRGVKAARARARGKRSPQHLADKIRECVSAGTNSSSSIEG